MRKFSLILFSFFIIASAFAEKKDVATFSKQDSAQILNRLQILEGQKENLKDSIENKFNDYKNNNDRQLNPIFILFTIVITISGLGMFGYFFYIKKYINDKINNHITNIVEGQKEKIIMLLHDQDFENILKKDKKYNVPYFLDSRLR
ncbi:MAG: hypothetical protein EAZ08_01920 [Cytophagales bacterium]|nr:MAG: hypothetical protein EAZ08_01920 [Cytophagales bacterium]